MNFCFFAITKYKFLNSFPILNHPKKRVNSILIAVSDEIFGGWLINGYRVDDFKNLLTNPTKQHITFLGLAYEAGFNSKASFNRVFKEFTGYSPSTYRKQLQ